MPTMWYNYTMRQKAHISFAALVLILLTLPFFATQAPTYGAEADFPLLAAPEEEELPPPRVVDMWVTAYSSSKDETDSTPHVTAIGTQTRDGIAATNMFPIGTLVRIPEFFGDKVFVIEDRMHPRKQWVLDVWMASKAEAKEFGSYLTKVEIVKEG